MEKRSEPQTRTESKTRIIESINACLHSGDYARALDSLRGAAGEFPNDPDVAELEKLAKDGFKRKAEADRLITESQELFAQRKSADAIQLLRKAYELDKSNTLARAILANALVEHAQSMVETDWLEAETLANQALALNPAHPTAKTIQSLILERKKTSSVEDWVAQARKRQSSGDLFAALAWVAEGLAVHPDNPKLLQIQESIQRDQGARRRQARRVDLEDLRRVEFEIDLVTDVAAKQALAERIQALAAKYWTDGEILAIANRLLYKLGLGPQESSSAAPQTKGGAVIFHVPPPIASRAPNRHAPISSTLPKAVLPSPVPRDSVPTGTIAAKDAPPSIGESGKAKTVASEPHVPPPPSAVLSTVPSAPANKGMSPRRRTERPTRSNSLTLVIISTTAILVFAAILFLARKHQAPPIARSSGAAASAPATAVSTPTSSTAPPVERSTAPLQTIPEPPAPAASSSDLPAEKVAPQNQPLAESGHDLGTLFIVSGQDDARVSLNGKLLPQVTRGGQLRLPNLVPQDYVVQVTKSGFQALPGQEVRIRKGEEAKLVFNLQPLPRLASLTIQGGTPGAAVLVDQTAVGTIQPDGTFTIPTVNPGDHVVELRKERFTTRQFRKRFVAGGAVTLVSADAALEAAPGELKIIFTPADANVAIAKGNFLKIVNSGVPLNLAPGSYTLTARTAERFTRASTVEVSAGELKVLNLSLAPSGMSKWEDAGAWKPEGDSFVRKGGDFVLYGVVPTSGTFVFSAMLIKGHLLQWVLNYTDHENYLLFQMDDNNFYRSVIRNGQKTDEIIVPHRGEKKSIRTFQIRVGPTEIVHQIKRGDSWTVLDRLTQPGVNFSAGKFGFCIPGNDQLSLSNFAHYGDLDIH